jgi:UDP-N-acetylglucosamine 2-epimerase (non-hydrolysing)
MAEVLTANLEKIRGSRILERLGLEKGNYLLLSAHREENIDDEASFFSLMNSVNALAEKYDMPILYSCHPRSAKFIERRRFAFDRRVAQSKPLGFHDYNRLRGRLLRRVEGNPAGGKRLLPFGGCRLPSAYAPPERPEALDKGNFIVAELQQAVLQAVETLVERQQRDLAPVSVYTDLNVSGNS